MKTAKQAAEIYVKQKLGVASTERFTHLKDAFLAGHSLGLNSAAISQTDKNILLNLMEASELLQVFDKGPGHPNCLVDLARNAAEFKRAQA